MVTLLIWLLLKQGQSHKNHINSPFCHNDTIHKVKLEFVAQFKRYHTKTLVWSKYDISKCWCDLENEAKEVKI